MLHMTLHTTLAALPVLTHKEKPDVQPLCGFTSSSLIHITYSKLTLPLCPTTKKHKKQLTLFYARVINGIASNITSKLGNVKK